MMMIHYRQGAVAGQADALVAKQRCLALHQVAATQ